MPSVGRHIDKQEVGLATRGNCADEEHGEGPHENGGRPRRQKKRSGRREKERQTRRSLAAAKEPEASSNPPPSAAFGEGCGVHDSSQAWAEGARLRIDALLSHPCLRCIHA